MTKRVLLTALLALAGCPHPPRGAVKPSTPAATPGADLTAAGDAPTPDGTEKDAAGDDPRLIDLDVIHMDVVGHDPNGDPIIESKTAGPYLDSGNKAFAAGKLDEAVIWYQ